MGSTTDYDSKACNKIEAEDNFARACVSVPSKICVERSERISLTAPFRYTNYQWYLNGQIIIGANSQEYTADRPGTYTLKLDSNQCPTGNCCPIYGEDFCECKPNICVLFTIIKVKK